MAMLKEKVDAQKEYREEVVSFIKDFKEEASILDTHYESGFFTHPTKGKKNFQRYLCEEIQHLMEYVKDLS